MFGGVFASLCISAAGHGAMTLPPNRAGGNMSFAGLSSAYGDENVGWWWFSQPVIIPGEPTLNAEHYRTYNVKVQNGTSDWSRKMPWRAPGAATVRGSGCGVAGGAPVRIPNGGEIHPDTIPMGMDGKDLPETEPAVWVLGSSVEVAFTMLANHGGGYTYRLCKKTENITEECFQRNPLKFSGNSSWIQYSDIIPNRTLNGFLDLPRFELPRVIVPEDQVRPVGSQWARNPVPSCFICDQAECGTLLPNLTEKVTGVPDNFGGDDWARQEACAQQCSGFNMVDCLPGMTQFPEPLPGVSGYLGAFMVSTFAGPPGIEGFRYSIVDKVEIPAELEAGEWVLSWRWDCEQSPQIWQNCADVTLVSPSVLV